jgi:hypothetical protein
LRVNLVIRCCAAAAAAAAAAILVVAGSGPAGAAVTPAGAASGWLAAELARNASSMPGFTPGSPDVGLTEDVVLALTAGGLGEGTSARNATAQIAAHVADFVSFDSLGASFKGVRLAGPLAKSLLVAEVQGGDPHAFGGWDLEGDLRALLVTSGPGAGRFSDKNAFAPDASNGFGQALALIALQRARDGAPAAAVGFLLAQQCPSGGFRLFYDTGTTCASDGETDTDATSLAVEALGAVTQTAAVHDASTKAVAWLLGHEDATTGAFSGTGPTATPNSNSTGLAAAALRDSGQTSAADKAAGYVEGLQLTTGPDAGALGYDDAAFSAVTGGTIDDLSRDQWRRSTSQAVLALGLPGYGHIVAVPAPASGGSGGPVTGGASTATLSATSVHPGGTLRITGGGFRAGEPVQVWLHSSPVLVGTAKASSAGTVSLTVTIPAATGVGSHRLVVLGMASAHQAVAAFSLVAAPVAAVAAVAAEAAGPTLPDTGGSIVLPTVLSASLLVAGAALLWLARPDAAGFPR